MINQDETIGKILAVWKEQNRTGRFIVNFNQGGITEIEVHEKYKGPEIYSLLLREKQ